ncbi:MAG: hypothetical protein K2P78_04150 [Gemmataceae bacterium]|nr:hypothetical protein [Gemmataceae bacterium]
MELATKDDMLVRGLAAAAAKVKAFARTTATAALALTATGGTALAPLAKVFRGTVENGAEIKKLSDRYAISAEKVSALAYAFERSGVGIEEFGATLDGLQSKMFSLADGGDELFTRFAKGINPAWFAMQKADRQVEILIDRINNLADPVDRAAVGAEFFGSAWGKIANGAGGSVSALRDLEEQARKAGAVMTDDEAARAKAINDDLTASWQALKYGILELGKAFLPASGEINSFADMIRNALGTAREWIAQNRGIVITVAAVSAALVAGGVALSVFSTALGVLSAAAGIATAALGLFGSALGLVLTPVGAVVLAVAGLTAAWLTLTDSGKRFAAEVSGAFESMGEVFTATWEGIVGAVAKGDLELAGRVAVAGLRAAWAEAMVFLTEQWVAFKDSVVDGWHEITDGLEKSVVGWQGYWLWATKGRAAAEEHVTGTLEQLEGEAKRRDEANHKFRAQQIADAKAERDRLRGELDALVNRARAPTGTGDPTKGGQFSDSGGLVKDKDGNLIAAPAQYYKSAKGTFNSSNLTGALGYGDKVGERQLRTQEQIRDEVKKLNQQLGKFGITFK